MKFRNGSTVLHRDAVPVFSFLTGIRTLEQSRTDAAQRTQTEADAPFSGRCPIGEMSDFCSLAQTLQ